MRKSGVVLRKVYIFQDGIAVNFQTPVGERQDAVAVNSPVTGVAQYPGIVVQLGLEAQADKWQYDKCCECTHRKKTKLPAAAR